MTPGWSEMSEEGIVCGWRLCFPDPFPILACMPQTTPNSILGASSLAKVSWSSNQVNTMHDGKQKQYMIFGLLSLDENLDEHSCSPE